MPVILCGGSSKRLWPISKHLPKQFLKIGDGSMSLLQQTIMRNMDAIFAKPLIVTVDEYMTQVAEHATKLCDIDVIVEPCAKNTAPSIVAAAAYLHAKDPDSVMVACPCDHFIADNVRYIQAIKSASTYGDYVICLICAEAKDASANLGYVKATKQFGDGYVVDGFYEKPAKSLARVYADLGYMWHCGIFVAKVKDILRYAEEIYVDYERVMRAVVNARIHGGVGGVSGIALSGDYCDIAPVSFDVAVLQRADRMHAVKIECEWMDLGTTQSLVKYWSA